MTLRISADLKLPIDATTQAMAFLGRRRSGKSYAATKLAELFYAAGAQFVAIDPVGIWWGLRLAADGKGKGIDVPIFGGLHGDIPLESTAGAMLADLVVDRGLSAVLDVSQFESDADKARFARDFAARFFFRKKVVKSAVHVFVEEAQEFIPQFPQKGEEQMLHAWQRMVRLGGNYGIGMSMISQRPQDVNKKALNQAECLFCFQLMGPQERKAVEGWISDKGLNDDLGSILPGLKMGHAHVWSPVWLGVSKEVFIAEKTTFPAGTTPKVGERPVVARPLAEIEMEQIRRDMAETVEAAKANDPKELRRRIAELERLQVKPPPQADPSAVQRAAQAGAKQWERRLADREKHWRSVAESLSRSVRHSGFVAMEKGAESLRAARELMEQACERADSEFGEPPPSAPVHRPEPAARPAPQASASHGDPGVGKGGLYRIMVALAQRNGLTSRQIGVRAGLASSGGSFRTYLSAARTRGWVRDEGDRRFITDEGVAALGNYEPLPSGGALLDYWLGQLGDSGASRILRVLAEAYPERMGNEQIAQGAGMEAGGGSFRTYMSKLRTLELVQSTREGTKASDEMFE